MESTDLGADHGRNPSVCVRVSAGMLRFFVRIGDPKSRRCIYLLATDYDSKMQYGLVDGDSKTDSFDEVPKLGAFTGSNPVNCKAAHALNYWMVTRLRVCCRVMHGSVNFGGTS